MYRRSDNAKSACAARFGEASGGPQRSHRALAHAERAACAAAVMIGMVASVAELAAWKAPIRTETPTESLFRFAQAIVQKDNETFKKYISATDRQSFERDVGRLSNAAESVKRVLSPAPRYDSLFTGAEAAISRALVDGNARRIKLVLGPYSEWFASLPQIEVKVDSESVRGELATVDGRISNDASFRDYFVFRLEMTRMGSFWSPQCLLLSRDAAQFPPYCKALPFPGVYFEGNGWAAVRLEISSVWTALQQRNIFADRVGAIEQADPTVSTVSSKSALAEALRAPPKKTERERAGLIGRVRMVRSDRFDYSRVSGQWAEKLYIREVVRYDDRGNTVERTQYGSDGALSSKTYSTHTPTGGHAESYRSNGSLLSRSIAYYAEDGTLISDVELFPRGPGICAVVSKLDPMGRPIEHATYVYARRFVSGPLVSKAIWTYDPQHKTVVMMKNINNQLRVVSQDVSVLDDNGNESSSVSYSPAGAVTSKSGYSYEFDSSGNWVTQRVYDMIRGIPVRTINRTITYY